MASFSDDFNRANSTTLGLGWVEFNGANTGLVLLNNQMTCTSDSFTQSFGFAYWGAGVASSDRQFSQATVGTAVTGSIVLSVRSESDGFPSITASFNCTNGAWAIRTTNDAGTSTNRVTGTASAGVAGQVLRLEANGTLYTLKRDGVTLGTWTDSGGLHVPGPTRRTVGVALSASGGGAFSVSLDNWSGGDISVDWTADASLAVVATPSGGMSAGLLIGASLAVTATPTVVGSRGQSMAASLAVAATPNDVGRYDAAAQANLFLDGVFTASMMKTLNGLATLAISVNPTASVTDKTTLSSDLQIGATTSAAAQSNRLITGSLDLTASPTAAAQRGHNVDSQSLPVTATTTAAAINKMICQANLVVNVNAVAIAHRITYAATALGLSVTTTGAIVKGPVIQANLNLAATPTASAQLRHSASASLAIEVLTSAVANAHYDIGADLAVLVSTVILVTGLREIIFVPFDDRHVDVPAGDRSAFALPEDRMAKVDAVVRLVEVLKRDSVASADAESRLSFVAPAPRFASVPAEIATVLA